MFSVAPLIHSPLCREIREKIPTLILGWKQNAYGDLSACDVLSDPDERARAKTRISTHVAATLQTVDRLFQVFDSERSTLPFTGPLQQLLAVETLRDGIKQLDDFTKKRAAPQGNFESALGQLESLALGELSHPTPESWQTVARIDTAIDRARTNVARCHTPEAVYAATSNNTALANQLKLLLACLERAWNEPAV